ncbi:MAG TPA: ATP-binding protein, partial [Anaerolineae bacterium]|nr:ATP-binding protein [Anaerolineae bacterium]
MSTFTPGQLYLGREYDLANDRLGDRPLLYKARHLTTHGLILGMTGSGKTGLGIILLEEVLLQGVPALILDPKGDITNLMLTFPDLRAEDFAPWVDLEGARRRDMSVAEYAEQEARKWREGLAKWGIGGERIAQLRQTARFTIFTPGSEAGEPVDVLHFFETPALDWEEYEEPLRERISGLVAALLGLVGVEADPLQSPEHILLSRIIEHVWRAGDPLDLPTLIRLLQNPPFRQVGVFELDAFLPEKERLTLARSLNNLIAAPGFEVWQEGTPLDIGELLYALDGRPQASIFYLAHLDDAQRMFFVTLFLEAARDWLRKQSGTTDLRALIYFDEVFGYFPPHPTNPPSKRPLLALIKQGRAAGLGVVLSTQNPADLDYKGLTNAGMWAVGSLRAERDKQRVMEGLEGALAEAGERMSRGETERALGSLKPRVFLFHDIHAGPPLFFHTRWAMSYLRGPLTR